MVDKIKFTGEFDVDLEGYLGNKGYTFWGEDQPYALRYGRGPDYFKSKGVLPPIDLAARIGATGPITGSWRWQATIGPSLNFAGYKSDAVPSDKDPKEIDMNTLAAIEYSLSHKVSVTSEATFWGVIPKGIDVGAYVEGRIGGVGFYNPTGEDASYIGAYLAHDWGTEPGANPLIGEIGLGGILGPFHLGIYSDTGMNTEFSNLDSTFEHYTKNDDGTWNMEPTTRTTSYRSGGTSSSIEPFGANGEAFTKESWSIKAGFDLIAAGRMVVEATAPKRAENKAKRAAEAAEAEKKAKADADAKEKADAEEKKKAQAEEKKKAAAAEAAKTQTIKVVIEGGGDSSDD